MESWQETHVSHSLGNHFDSFSAQYIKMSQYSSACEVIRAGLRILEDKETKIETLRSLLLEGENSGFAEYSYGDAIAAVLNQEDILAFTGH